jgi:peptidoglycan/xylan/chitin deacetylase (PgdA/CDA1 family)
MSEVPGTAAAVSHRKIPILMYHEVADRNDTTSQLAVHPAAFAAQLKHLNEIGATTLTLSEAASILAGNPIRLPERPIAITFDDGFADFHERALPLLYEYGFTATVFVTTGWISDAGPNSAGQRPGRMLSWSQIREATEAGIEIGAHSHGHPQLDQIPLGKLRSELTFSKALLEDSLGLTVPSMAYPFGYSNARVRQVVSEIGYARACVVGNMIAGPYSDPFALKRLTVRRSTNPAKFEVMVRGQAPTSLLKDRSLTKGWAMVRRTRAFVTGAVRRQTPESRDLAANAVLKGGIEE